MAGIYDTVKNVLHRGFIEAMKVNLEDPRPNFQEHIWTKDVKCSTGQNKMFEFFVHWYEDYIILDVSEKTEDPRFVKIAMFKADELSINTISKAIEAVIDSFCE